ncbi:hypothetical protein Q4I30_006171 [Leishmania utingensis]|uniref:Uncharacterized protein n=1 Tax=Leishmania utingensis TaxID=653362 RepID=A0AAW3A3Q8_9TRYP
MAAPNTCSGEYCLDPPLRSGSVAHCGERHTSTLVFEAAGGHLDSENRALFSTAGPALSRKLRDLCAGVCGLPRLQLISTPPRRVSVTMARPRFEVLIILDPAAACHPRQPSLQFRGSAFAARCAASSSRAAQISAV